MNTGDGLISQYNVILFVYNCSLYASCLYSEVVHVILCNSTIKWERYCSWSHWECCSIVELHDSGPSDRLTQRLEGICVSAMLISLAQFLCQMVVPVFIDQMSNPWHCLLNKVTHPAVSEVSSYSAEYINQYITRQNLVTSVIVWILLIVGTFFGGSSHARA